MFRTKDFCVIQTEMRFCYMEVGCKIKDEYIYCFMKFS